jgi:hypothetical protein
MCEGERRYECKKDSSSHGRQRKNTSKTAMVFACESALVSGETNDTFLFPDREQEQSISKSINIITYNKHLF